MRQSENCCSLHRSCDVVSCGRGSILRFMPRKPRNLRPNGNKCSSAPRPRPAARCCCSFLLALADSVHWRNELPKQTVEATVAYDTKTVSLLDTLVLPHIAGRERSYSAPFALHDFDKTTVIRDGKSVRDYQRLTGASPDVPEKGALPARETFFCGVFNGGDCALNALDYPGARA